jgi:hypothetical protein
MRSDRPSPWRSPAQATRSLGVLALGLSLVSAPPAGARELIDRVMAVVAGHVITLSDVRGALDLRLVRVGAEGDRLGAALARLIDRRLVLQEVDRYQPPEPEARIVDERVAALRASAGSPEAVSAVFAATAMNDARLRDHARDELRIEAYLNQRFAATAQPTEDEVAKEYEARREQYAPLSLAEAFDAIRRRLGETRREALIAEWIAGLRGRAAVTLLYLPGR